MIKEDIIFKPSQLMFVSMATPVANFETYIPVCDLPYSQRSVLPKGAVYEIGVWNKNRTKFMLLREFGIAIEVKEDDERFDIKDFRDEYKKSGVVISPTDFIEGIAFENITKENKILLRKNLQSFAEKLAQNKGRNR
jgi:hypothetical protein